ncbi:V-type ATP synthase subunit K, partial [bacterium]|nr:V-type ATP synthase subunit K [bacterium]
TVFAGAPLSQTIYGMIIMFIILGGKAQYYPTYLAIGIVGGIAIGLSAWMQGKAAAGACDAFGETGKGFVNYLLALGIIETVAIFIMAFSLILISKLPA